MEERMLEQTIQNFNNRIGTAKSRITKKNMDIRDTAKKHFEKVDKVKQNKLQIDESNNYNALNTFVLASLKEQKQVKLKQKKDQEDWALKREKAYDREEIMKQKIDFKRKEKSDKLIELNKGFNKKDDIRASLQRKMRANSLMLREMNALRQQDAYDNRMLKKSEFYSTKA